MAEFQKVTEEAKRMCWHYTQKGSHAGCPMYPACNVSQCRKIAFERPAEFEEHVMAWAAENPEPVYPLWFEWLEKIGVAGRAYDLEPYFMGDKEIFQRTAAFTAKAFEPIPADIAQKLGLKPKEG